TKFAPPGCLLQKWLPSHKLGGCCGGWNHCLPPGQLVPFSSTTAHHCFVVGIPIAVSISLYIQPPHQAALPAPSVTAFGSALATGGRSPTMNVFDVPSVIVVIVVGAPHTGGIYG